MAKQPTTNDVPLDVLIPRPRVEVIERGLANVFGLPSTEIKLKDPEMVTHWCNTAINGNQLGSYLDAGYLKVRPEMLADPDRVSFTVSPDGYVTTGPRHEEILLYTLRSVKAERLRRRTERNMQSMSPRETKAEIVEKAAAKFGDEAASMLDRRSGPIGGVHDSYERIAVRPGEE